VIAAAAIARAWLALIGMTALGGTLLALLALAVTRIGRLRPAWQAAIWLVVTIKLALPWAPALPWSLSDLIGSLRGTDAGTAASALPPALQPLPTPASIWPAIGWLLLAGIWTAGAVRVIVRAGRAQLRDSRAAVRAPDAPDRARTLLAALAARVGVAPPRLAIGSPTLGPHVVGLVRPTIVVPPALLAEPALLHAALLHELVHVRRRDALGRLVQIAASALVWWLPVPRLVARRLELAREAACDAWALELGEIPRPTYARLLVQMASLRAAAAPSLAAPHALDARIAAVLGPPARPRLAAWHRLALAAWILLALGGARRAEAREAPPCRYTPQLAAALYLAHPEADLDGDGVLSQAEACQLQAELQAARASREDASASFAEPPDPLLSEPLCCNCDQAGAYSTPEAATCHSVEGVVR